MEQNATAEPRGERDRRGQTDPVGPAETGVNSLNDRNDTRSVTVCRSRGRVCQPVLGGRAPVVGASPVKVALTWISSLSVAQLPATELVARPRAPRRRSSGSPASHLDFRRRPRQRRLAGPGQTSKGYGRLLPFDHTHARRSSMPTGADRYRQNRQGEIDSAYVYRAMAGAERKPQLSSVYARLASVEERHLAFWEDQMRSAGAAPGPRRPSWRARLMGSLATRFGARIVLPTVATLEQVDQGGSDNQPETANTQPCRDQERSHARVLRYVAGGRPRALLERRSVGSRAVTGRSEEMRCEPRSSVPTTVSPRTWRSSWVSPVRN